MKWNVIKKGQRRVIKKFAWLPTKLDTDLMVWLESYFACQEYNIRYPSFSVKWNTIHNTQSIDHADAWKGY